MNYLQSTFAAAGLALLPASQASASISFDPTWQQVQAIEACYESSAENMQECVLEGLTQEALQTKALMEKYDTDQEIVDYMYCNDAQQAIVLSEHYAIALRIGTEGSYELTRGSDADFDAMIKYFEAQNSDLLGCSALYPEPEEPVILEEGMPDYSAYTLDWYIQELKDQRQDYLLGME